MINRIESFVLSLSKFLYNVTFFTMGFAIGTASTVVLYKTGFNEYVGIITHPYLAIPLSIGFCGLIYLLARSVK